MFHLLLSTLVAQTATMPARPPDGTYTYALSQGNGQPIFTSRVVVKSHGPTFDVSETAKLPNGATATTTTTWSSASLLPLNYSLRQGSVNIHGAITSSSVKFTINQGSAHLKPLSYTLMPGTKYMLVYEGLNAFRMMLPYVIAAHPKESATVGHINGVQRERAQASTASPQHGGPSGDAVSVLTLDKERITVWRNPKSGVIDEERVSPGNFPMTLQHYSP
ncbi:MAG TPA: hypothetical protein VKT72_13805 [Candidatus Baltobacteraceae bacterium]|nr:hypothetical protein [Candidatus Baltobacteraceae bacterium]